MMGKTNKAYFRAAKAVSELSDYPRHKIGCVIIDKHHIISSGYNSNSKTHPIQSKLDTEHFGVECPGKVHAESAALIPLIKNKIDLHNAEIYIYRKHKSNCLALARPCNRCMRLIKMCGIKKLHYTTEDGYAYEKLI